jgi:hypothetical protein
MILILGQLGETWSFEFSTCYHQRLPLSVHCFHAPCLRVGITRFLIVHILHEIARTFLRIEELAIPFRVRPDRARSER